MSSASTSTPAHQRGISPAPAAPQPRPGSAVFLTLLAVCSAVTAANIYLAAPLLSLIADDFGAAPSAVAWIASVAQLGYAVGLLFFAPLGDTANRRRLVTVLTLVTTLALIASSVAPGTSTLAGAVSTIESGMGGILGHVAIIIGLGTMLGAILEVSGGAEVLASR
ncbi:MFS transporter, partial [Streptomyces sp. 15-116A]|uniref:GntT/GntP/DsdX family permease n=1 Tax=Streptomyces sp. 15-116A TaxID=2259035 RepID=UPI0021B36A72